MKQFTNEIAEKFFELIEEADYISQNKNGEVYWWSSKPTLEERVWEAKYSLARFICKYEEHSNGWKNSLCKRKPKEYHSLTKTLLDNKDDMNEIVRTYLEDKAVGFTGVCTLDFARDILELK